MADVVVKKSKINCMGAFADRDFKKGELVIKWDTSDSFSQEEVDRMSPEERKYITCFKGKYTMMKSPGRYVNHSCDPSVYLENFLYIAKRDIKKGEEITTDYSDEMISDQVMKCACGNKNCRGIIKIRKTG